jgi:hypothetical protein
MSARRNAIYVRSTPTRPLTAQGFSFKSFQLQGHRSYSEFRMKNGKKRRLDIRSGSGDQIACPKEGSRSINCTALETV